MIKSDPVCNTGDLITITLIHGGQIFSSSAKETSGQILIQMLWKKIRNAYG